MHLIKDENGNLVQHGHGHTHEHTHEDGMTHTHEHTHGEGHDHGHSHADHACDTAHCGSCSEGDCKNETLALLTYMLQHNEHHGCSCEDDQRGSCRFSETQYETWTCLNTC